MKRYSAKTIIATELGWSNEDLEEYRYHYGRTDRPVYAIDGDYYCAVKVGQKPAKHTESVDRWAWSKYTSPQSEKLGWQIWISK